MTKKNLPTDTVIDDLEGSPFFKRRTLFSDSEKQPHQKKQATVPVNQKTSMPESQQTGMPAIQRNKVANEKVTYRFHPEGKYAVEDMKTILPRHHNIKASLEQIAEEAILIAYEDLLEN